LEEHELIIIIITIIAIIIIIINPLTCNNTVWPEQ